MLPAVGPRALAAEAPPVACVALPATAPGAAAPAVRRQSYWGAARRCGRVSVRDPDHPAWTAPRGAVQVGRRCRPAPAAAPVPVRADPRVRQEPRAAAGRYLSFPRRVGVLVCADDLHPALVRRAAREVVHRAAGPEERPAARGPVDRAARARRAVRAAPFPSPSCRVLALRLRRAADCRRGVRARSVRATGAVSHSVSAEPWWSPPAPNVAAEQRDRADRRRDATPALQSAPPPGCLPCRPRFAAAP